MICEIQYLRLLILQYVLFLSRHENENDLYFYIKIFIIIKFRSLSIFRGRIFYFIYKILSTRTVILILFDLLVQ